MIQADAPMCEEWGWKKGRDGKEEPSECSHMPVGCCKSGFYVGDFCGCLVRCFSIWANRNVIFKIIILLFCQYYFFTRNVQALSAQSVEISVPIVLLASSVSTRNRDAMTLTSTLGGRTRTLAGVYLILIELEFAKVKTMQIN